jgi:GMP synthase-like glutamine amidotransferase
VRALVIGNGDDLDPGFVGHRLREHGYAFTEGHREHPDRWPALDGFELVLTLGSEWNVYRRETAALVEAEASLVRTAVTAGVPLLGVCFGAQVLAHAMGATVSRSPTPEIGWYDVDVDEPAVAAGPWLQWHLDVFTVPDGFVELGRSSAGPQVVVGGRALGTQFHPEVTESMVTRWLAMGGAEQVVEHGGDPDALLGATRANVARSRPNAEALVDWFLSKVAGA